MWIEADHRAFTYSGRIDFTDPKAPVLVYACSYVQVNFTGTRVAIRMQNQRNCYFDSMGILLDGVHSKIELSTDRECHTYLVADNLPEGEHSLMLYKRMDGGAHYVVFYGLELAEGAKVLPGKALPNRRIEVIGDSVSCGEVCEALDRVAMSDPDGHEGRYSNSWYSYSWQVARNLGAELHNTSQGGISLLDNTGYFNGPLDLRGVESSYRRLQYNPPLGMKPWNHELWKPHVVVLAFGQNDASPVDIMGTDYEGPAAEKWRQHYREFILQLLEMYPGVRVILTTTVLMHDPAWDKAIHQVCAQLNHPQVSHFLYRRTGKATPGHPRIPEHDEMAEELTAYIESLGEEIWK